MSCPYHWTLTEAILIVSNSKFWGKGMRKVSNANYSILFPGTIHSFQTWDYREKHLDEHPPFPEIYCSLILGQGLQMTSTLHRRPGKPWKFRQNYTLRQIFLLQWKYMIPVYPLTLRKLWIELKTDKSSSLSLYKNSPFPTHTPTNTISNKLVIMGLFNLVKQICKYLHIFLFPLCFEKHECSIHIE